MTRLALFFILVLLMNSIPPVSLHGHVLTIYDESDERDWVVQDYFGMSPEMSAGGEIVTGTGLGHGLLYTAHPAWLEPTLAWLGRR